MSKKTGRVTDPRTLRVIAHPVRLRLYELLVTEGPATMTRLAKSIAGAPGSLSYHLHQLAECGYIEEAPELRKDERERWWRAVPGGIRWSQEDFPDTAGAQEILSSAERVLVGRRVDRLRAWLSDGEARWGREWTAASRSTDTMLHLTPDELRQLGVEIDQVLERWVRASRAAHSQPGPDRVPVFAFFHAFPFSGDAPEKAGSASDHDASAEQ